MNKVTVKINGIDYNLKGEETAEYLTEIAGYVDKKLRNLIDGNKKLSTSSAAILTAMNAADELFKEKEDAKDIKNQFSLLKSQIAYLEKHNKELEEKVTSLDNHLKEQNQDANKDFDNRINELNEYIKEKESQLSDLGKEKESLEQQLIKEVQFLKKEINENEKVSNKKLDEKNNIISDLNTKIQEVKQYYENKIELVHQNYKEQLNKINNVNEKIQNDLIKANENNGELKKEINEYKNQMNLKVNKELNLKKEISNLQIKFKEYEENNSFKDENKILKEENNSFKEKIKNLNKEAELLTIEAKKYKEMNKKIIKRNETDSFKSRSNFYKLKAYEDKYIGLLERFIESQIENICLKKGIKYKSPINIIGSLGKNKDIDIEDEMIFLSRNKNIEKKELKDKILINSVQK